MTHNLTCDKCKLYSNFYAANILIFNVLVKNNLIIRVIMDRVKYIRPLLKLIKIINATSLSGFHIRKQMSHPPSFGLGHQSGYLVL